LTATATGNGTKLTWDAVDSAAAYRIYRSADGGKTYILVSTRLAKNFHGKTPYFNDTTVVNSGSYIYAIRAYDSSLSNATRSDEVTTTVTV
jgi:fibronectin type 3 domain-containing protein